MENKMMITMTRTHDGGVEWMKTWKNGRYIVRYEIRVHREKEDNA